MAQMSTRRVKTRLSMVLEKTPYFEENEEPLLGQLVAQARLEGGDFAQMVLDITTSLESLEREGIVELVKRGDEYVSVKLLKNLKQRTEEKQKGQTVNKHSAEETHGAPAVVFSDPDPNPETEETPDSAEAEKATLETISRLSKKVIEMGQRNAELVESNDQHVEEKAQLKQDMAELTSGNTQLKSENEQHVADATQHTAELASAQAENDRLKRDNEKLTRQLEAAAEQLVESDARARAAEIENDKLKESGSEIALLATLVTQALDTPVK